MACNTCNIQHELNMFGGRCFLELMLRAGEMHIATICFKTVKTKVPKLINVWSPTLRNYAMELQKQAWHNKSHTT